MNKLKVTLKKSGIGNRWDQKRTIESLGLRKLNQTVEHDDTPSIRGMLFKIRHLIEVQEIT